MSNSNINDLEAKAEVVITKIKHYLITTYGKMLDECSNYEFYHSFCLALREEIMINWTAVARWKTYRIWKGY